MSVDAVEVEDVHCAVFVALREEFRPLASRLEGSRGCRRKALRYTVGRLGGKKIAICRTGIGRQNALRKARALLEEVRPDVVLVTGFAGGLAADWVTGDCLVASRVTDGDPASPTVGEALTRRAPRSWDAPASLVDRALSAPSGHRVRTGHLVSVDRVLRSAAEKVAAGDELQAQAADMESSGVLTATSEAGIPALCVRVIIDDCGFELPLDFGKIMTPEGDLDPLRTVLTVGTSPHKWPRLVDLRRRAIVATAVLASTVPRIIEAL